VFLQIMDREQTPARIDQLRRRIEVNIRRRNQAAIDRDEQEITDILNAIAREQLPEEQANESVDSTVNVDLNSDSGEDDDETPLPTTSGMTQPR
jgi:hypothetical protein